MNEKQTAEIAFAIENIEQEIKDLSNSQSIDIKTIGGEIYRESHLKSALYHLKEAGYGYKTNELDFDPETQIAIIWGLEDVKSLAKDNHINITDQQALEILHKIEKQHDATIGVNWEVISCHLSMLGDL